MKALEDLELPDPPGPRLFWRVQTGVLISVPTITVQLRQQNRVFSSLRYESWTYLDTPDQVPEMISRLALATLEKYNQSSASWRAYDKSIKYDNDYRRKPRWTH